MAKRTLTVSHNGQTFTRTTERLYTHAIVVRSDYDNDRKNATTWAAEHARDNHPYYVREADPATRVYKHDADELARLAKAAAMTLDQYVQSEVDAAGAKVDARRAAGEYEKFKLLEWCGRNDLAHNAYGKAQRGMYAEVVLLTVAQP